MTKTMTWAERLKDIEESDMSLNHYVIDKIKRVTAPARHAQRVENTINAVQYSHETNDPDDSDVYQATAPIYNIQVAWEIAADLNGLGGVFGLGGNNRKTVRATWATNDKHSLGTGRWNANDGKAYEAASIDAFNKCTREGIINLVYEDGVLKGYLLNDDIDRVPLPFETEQHLNLLTKIFIAGFISFPAEWINDQVLPMFDLDQKYINYIPILLNELSLRLETEAEEEPNE